jgi:hypothetical protein
MMLGCDRCWRLGAREPAGVRACIVSLDLVRAFFWSAAKSQMVYNKASTIYTRLARGPTRLGWFVSTGVVGVGLCEYTLPLHSQPLRLEIREPSNPFGPDVSVPKLLPPVTSLSRGFSASALLAGLRS